MTTATQPRYYADMEDDSVLDRERPDMKCPFGLGLSPLVAADFNSGDEDPAEYIWMQR